MLRVIKKRQKKRKVGVEISNGNRYKGTKRAKPQFGMICEVKEIGQSREEGGRRWIRNGEEKREEKEKVKRKD